MPGLHECQSNWSGYDAKGDFHPELVNYGQDGGEGADSAPSDAEPGTDDTSGGLTFSVEFPDGEWLHAAGPLTPEQVDEVLDAHPHLTEDERAVIRAELLGGEPQPVDADGNPIPTPDDAHADPDDAHANQKPAPSIAPPAPKPKRDRKPARDPLAPKAKRGRPRKS